MVDNARNRGKAPRGYDRSLAATEGRDGTGLHTYGRQWFEKNQHSARKDRHEKLSHWRRELRGRENPSGREPQKR
jgi:hypothetical protein